MTYTYRIVLRNAQGVMMSYRTVATSLTEAITITQTFAGVSVDPDSTQLEGPINPSGAIQI